jgi:hypothetical protein
LHLLNALKSLPSLPVLVVGPHNRGAAAATGWLANCCDQLLPTLVSDMISAHTLIMLSDLYMRCYSLSTSTAACAACLAWFSCTAEKEGKQHVTGPQVSYFGLLQPTNKHNV